MDHASATQESINALIKSVFEGERSRPKPDLIMVSLPMQHVMKATIDFKGRNWRRIKREQNKAFRLAKKRERDWVARKANPGLLLTSVPTNAVIWRRAGQR